MIRRLLPVVLFVLTVAACVGAAPVSATGSGWIVVPSPAVTLSQMNGVIVNAGGDPVAVGYSTDDPEGFSYPDVFAFYGGRWNQTAFHGINGWFYAISQTSGREVAVGHGNASGVIETRSVPGGRWHPPASWNPRTHVHITYTADATIPGSGHTLIVGWGRGTRPFSHRPVIAEFHGTHVSWVPVGFTVSEPPHWAIHATSVAVCSPSHGYIGVDSGSSPDRILSSHIWLWNGHEVTGKISLPSGEEGITAIACLPGTSSLIVAVGHGDVYKLTGTTWTAIPYAAGNVDAVTSFAFSSATSGTAAAYSYSPIHYRMWTTLNWDGTTFQVTRPFHPSDTSALFGAANGPGGRGTWVVGEFGFAPLYTFVMHHA